MACRLRRSLGGALDCGVASEVPRLLRDASMLTPGTPGIAGAPASQHRVSRAALRGVLPCRLCVPSPAVLDIRSRRLGPSSAAPALGVRHGRVAASSRSTSSISACPDRRDFPRWPECFATPLSASGVALCNPGPSLPLPGAARGPLPRRSRGVETYVLLDLDLALAVKSYDCTWTGFRPAPPCIPSPRRLPRGGRDPAD